MTTLSPERWVRRPPSVAVVVLAILAGCGGDSAGLHSPVAAALRVAGGDKQTGAAGSPLAQPIVVEVVDAGGSPVPGTSVTFTVTAGSGTVSASSASSDASGRATTQWTLGTKAGDAQQLAVSVASSASVPSLAITAAAVAGSPAVLDATPSISGRIGLALPPIAVALRDRYGNLAPSAGIRIVPRLDATSSQSLVGSSGIATDSSGAVITGLSITGKAGAATLMLDADGMTSGRVSVTLAGGAPVRTQVSGSGSIDATAGAAGPPIGATPIDAWDNPVANVDVTFSIDGVGVIGHATSGSDGVATLSTWTAPALGSYRLTAAAAGASSAQFSLTTHRPAPATLTPSPSNLTAGQAGSELVLDVKATDAAGNPVPEAPLTWSSGAKHGGGNTDNTGVAHLDVQLDTKVGTMAVLVQAGPNVAATMNVQIVPARFATVVAIKQQVTAQAGTSIVLSFLTTDFYGNPTPAQQLYATPDFWITGATITPTATSGPDGVAQFTLVLDPWAVEQQFGVAPSPGKVAWWAATTVTSTSTKGSVRMLDLECSEPPNSNLSTNLVARVFGTDGKGTSGVPVTFSTQPGNGLLIGPDHPQPSQTLTTPSDANGFAEPSWILPFPAGDYKVGAQAQAPYDGGAQAFAFCHIG
jgi:adhesin/invasin